MSNIFYLSGFQYKNTILQFFPHAEGYVNAKLIKSNYKFNYVFNFTDHLGNIRLSYSQDPVTNVLKIIEENHYYPFGLKHTNYNSDIATFKVQNETVTIAPSNTVDYKYKYNGKEYQDELGLNMYDYGARNYDPAIGRWMNIDPLAEQYRRWSPYNFCVNNPMRFIDPDGMGVNDVTIIGSLAKKATKQLDASTSLNITRDKKTGKLSATGEAKTDADKELLKAINDDKVNVVLYATSDNTIKQNGTEKIIIGGSFGGSKENEDGTVTAYQTINPNQAKIIEGVTNSATGVIALHEVLEAYIGAKDSPGAKPDSDAYVSAHNKAEALDPRRENRVYEVDQFVTNVDTGTNTGTLRVDVFRPNGWGRKKLFQQDNVKLQPRKFKQR